MDKNLRELAIAAVRKAPVSTFSKEDVEHALREELRKISCISVIWFSNEYSKFSTP